MTRRSRVLLAVVLGLVVVLVVVPLMLLVAAPMVYFPLVERSVRSATGFELTLENMAVGLFPAEVSLSGLTLANPAFQAPLLRADEVFATASLGDYLGEEPTWWRASASGMHVRLEQDAQGNSNWEPAAAEAPAGEAGAVFAFSVVELSDVTIERVSEQSHRFHVRVLRLEKAADEQLRIDLDGRYQDQPLQASGTLALPSSERATDLDFRASVFGGTVSVDGRVGHDGIVPGRAAIKARFDDLEALGLLLDEDLAFLEPVAVDAVLAAPAAGQWQLEADGVLAGERLRVDGALGVEGQVYRLQELTLAFGASSVEASGSADLAQHRLQGRLEAGRIAADELMQVRPAPAEQRSSGPATEPQPALQMPQALEAWRYDLALSVAEFAYRGFRMDGLTLALHDEQDTVVFTGSVDRAALPPDLGGGRLVEPLSADGRLRLPAAGSAAAVRAEAHITTAGLEGQVHLLVPPGARDRQRVALQAELTSFAAIHGVELSESIHDDLMPLKVDMEAVGRDAAWDVELAGAGVAGTEFNGQLSIDAAAEPIRVSGRLQSPEIDLNDVPTTTAAALDSEGAGDEESDSDSGGLISDAPIDWSWLELASVDLDLGVDRLGFNQTVFHNARSHLRLQDGDLSIEPVSASLSSGGGVRGQVRITRREEGANVGLRLVVSQLVPADLGQSDEGLIDGGETDLVVDVRAAGRSPQELAATLSGELALEVQQATVRNNILERVGGDLLMEFLAMVNPFVERDEQTELNCAAVHLVAENGKVTSPNRMVFETSKLVIRAGGTVNLADETLTLDFMPSPRQGLGLGMGGLADLVRLGGTLSDPQPEANPAGALRSGAKVGAAIATGGASLIAQGLFARARNAGTACGSIFEEHAEIPDEIQAGEPPDGSS